MLLKRASRTVSRRAPILHLRRRSGQTVGVDIHDGDLNDRQRAVLDFERTWWQFDELRDDVIRARFGCDLDEYYAELDQVLEHPGAMRHDPLVVRRFQRRRLRRRQALIEHGSRHASDDMDELWSEG
jgi:Protein of unknown function (DUF3263)